jgi:hypothetical protein
MLALALAGAAGCPWMGRGSTEPLTEFLHNETGIPYSKNRRLAAIDRTEAVRRPLYTEMTKFMQAQLSQKGNKELDW